MGNIPSNKARDIDEAHFVEFHSEVDDSQQSSYSHLQSQAETVEETDHGDVRGKPPVDTVQLSGSWTDVAYVEAKKQPKKPSKLKISTRIRSSKRRQSATKEVPEMQRQSSTDGGRTEDESSNVETSDQESTIVERKSRKIEAVSYRRDDESSNIETSDQEGSIVDRMSYSGMAGSVDSSEPSQSIFKPLSIKQTYMIGGYGRTEGESSTLEMSDLESPPQHEDVSRQWETRTKDDDGRTITGHGTAHHFHDITSDSGVSSDEYGDWQLSRSAFGDKEWYKDWRKSVSTYENKYFPYGSDGSSNVAADSPQISPIGGTSTFKQTDHQQQFHERQVIKNLKDSAEKYISQSIGDVSGMGRTGYSSQKLDLKIKETRGDTVVIKNRHGKMEPSRKHRADDTTTTTEYYTRSSKGRSDRHPAAAATTTTNVTAREGFDQFYRTDGVSKQTWEQHRHQKPLEPRKTRDEYYTRVAKETSPRRAYSCQTLTRDEYSRYLGDVQMKEGKSLREILEDGSVTYRRRSSQEGKDLRTSVEVRDGVDVERRSPLSPRVDRESQAYITTMAESGSVRHEGSSYVTSHGIEKTTDSKADSSSKIQLGEQKTVDYPPSLQSDMHLRERYAESTVTEPYKSESKSKSTDNIALSSRSSSLPFSRHTRREYEYHQSTAGIASNAKTETEMKELYLVDGANRLPSHQMHRSTGAIGSQTTTRSVDSGASHSIDARLSSTSMMEQVKKLDSHQEVSKSADRITMPTHTLSQTKSEVQSSKDHHVGEHISRTMARGRVSPTMETSTPRHFVHAAGGDTEAEWKESIDTQRGSRAGRNAAFSSRSRKREFVFHMNRKGLSSSTANISTATSDFSERSGRGSHTTEFTIADASRSLSATAGKQERDAMRKPKSPTPQKSEAASFQKTKETLQQKEILYVSTGGGETDSHGVRSSSAADMRRHDQESAHISRGMDRTRTTQVKDDHHHWFGGSGGDTESEWKESVDTQRDARSGQGSSLSSRRQKREFEFHINRRGLSSSCVDFTSGTKESFEGRSEQLGSATSARTIRPDTRPYREMVDHIHKDVKDTVDKLTDTVVLNVRSSGHDDVIKGGGSTKQVTTSSSAGVFSSRSVADDLGSKESTDRFGAPTSFRDHHRSDTTMSSRYDKSGATGDRFHDASSQLPSERRIDSTERSVTSFSSRGQRTFEYRKNTTAIEADAKEETETKETLTRFGSKSEGVDAAARRSQSLGIQSRASREEFMSTDTGISKPYEQSTKVTGSTTDQWHDAVDDFRFMDSSKRRDLCKSTGNLHHEREELMKVTAAYEKPLRESRLVQHHTDQEKTRLVTEGRLQSDQRAASTTRPPQSQKRVTYADDIENRSKSMDTMRTQTLYDYKSHPDAGLSNRTTRRIFEYTRNTTAVDAEADVSTKSLELFDRYGNKIPISTTTTTTTDATSKTTQRSTDRSHMITSADMARTSDTRRQDATHIQYDTKVTDSGSVISLGFGEKTKASVSAPIATMSKSTGDVRETAALFLPAATHKPRSTSYQRQAEPKVPDSTESTFTRTQSLREVDKSAYEAESLTQGGLYAAYNVRKEDEFDDTKSNTRLWTESRESVTGPEFHSCYGSDAHVPLFSKTKRLFEYHRNRSLVQPETTVKTDILEVKRAEGRTEKVTGFRKLKEGISDLFSKKSSQKTEKDHEETESATSKLARFREDLSKRFSTKATAEQETKVQERKIREEEYKARTHHHIEEGDSQQRNGFGRLKSDFSTFVKRHQERNDKYGVLKRSVSLPSVKRTKFPLLFSTERSSGRGDGIFTSRVICDVTTPSPEKRLAAIPCQPPIFMAPLRNADVYAGEKVVLETRVRGDPEPEILWRHNNRPIRDSRDYKIYYDGYIASLTLTEAYPNNSGSYSVHAKNKAGEASSSCNVTVRTKIPDTSDSDVETGKPRFLQELRNIIVTEGDSARLDCVIIGNPEPEVIWYIEDRPVKESANRRLYFEGDRCSLVIPASRLEDAALYKCVARNQHGETTSFCKLTVLAKPLPPKIVGSPPKFIENLESQVIEEGTRVVFEARATGEPSPGISWYRNGEELRQNQNVSIQSDTTGWLQLCIHRATIDDSGVYMVIANNDSGEAKSICRLQVNVPQPVITEMTKSIHEHEFIQTTHNTPPEIVKHLPDVSALHGDTVTMEAVVIGNPKPKITWHFNGVTTEPRHARYTSVGDSYIVTISSLSPHNAGEYRLVAENTAGKAETFGKLSTAEEPKRSLDIDTTRTEHRVVTIQEGPTEVYIPPKFVKTLVSVVVVEGQPATFDGIVTGTPVPEMSWQKDGVDYIDTRALISYHNGKVRLHIENTKLNDTGKFVCSARNAGGLATSAAQLIVRPVIAAPDFKQRLVSKEVEEGSLLEWRVQVVGDPEPQVTWYRQNEIIKNCPEVQIIKEGNGVHCLKIMKAEIVDTGQFTARAENEGGEARSTADLVVRRKGQEAGGYVHVTKIFQEQQEAGMEVSAHTFYTGSK